MKPYKLVICGEVGSTNLGDAVIADCLTYLIHTLAPSIQVVHLDLSARQAQRPGSTHKASSPLNRLKQQLAQFPRLFYLLRFLIKQLTPTRQPQLPADAQLLIIGGGQLLMDNAWRFPLDLLHVVRVANQKQLPTAIHACGVGKHWSLPALWLLRRLVLAPCVFAVNLRDLQSQNRLKERLADCSLPPLTHAVDPAVWAGAVYPGVKESQPNLAAEPPRIGLGVMSPEKLPLSAQALQNFWVDLACQLIHQGYAVTLFTNGAPEDENFLDGVMQQLHAHTPVPELCQRAPVPRQPSELVELIGGLASLFAFRLHAAIIAFSLGVPAVSYAWDDKVLAFNQSVGRASWVLTTDQLKAEQARIKLLAAWQAGVCPRSRQEAKEASRNALKQLLKEQGVL